MSGFAGAVKSKWAVTALSLVFALPAAAQFQTPSPGKAVENATRATVPSADPDKQAEPDQSNSPTGAEVLTDIKGFKIQPYLNKMLPLIRDGWVAALHETIDHPERRHGTVILEFLLVRSGEISEIRTVSSSGDDDLDRAAVQGLKNASPLPPFPKALPNNKLYLRFHFDYKETKDSRWWKRH